MNALGISESTGGLCFFTLTVAGILLYKQRAINSRRNEGYFKKIFKPSLSFDEYFPPLPNEVVEVLRTSKLCYLATQSDGNPHLSLMNFTYCRKEEVLILSTRRNTKKFYQIIENPKVAVLIHDFPVEVVVTSPSNSGESTVADRKTAKQWSITLNGVAEATIDGELITEYYRTMHLENNPNYAQFIVGNDIAVLIIRIDKARMCDVQDRVSYWNARDGVTGIEI